MNAILKYGWVFLAVAALPTALLAAPAPYGSAVNKAMHPGRPHVAQPQVRWYVQPRAYAQPRVYAVPAAPQTAAAPWYWGDRRTFSYEPAQPAAPMTAAPAIMEGRRTFSYEPQPMIVPQGYGTTPRRGFENATSKALGQR
jgi:hypothetical protein